MCDPSPCEEDEECTLHPRKCVAPCPPLAVCTPIEDPCNGTCGKFQVRGNRGLFSNPPEGATAKRAIPMVPGLPPISSSIARWVVALPCRCPIDVCLVRFRRDLNWTTRGKFFNAASFQLVFLSTGTTAPDTTCFGRLHSLHVYVPLARNEVSCNRYCV